MELTAELKEFALTSGADLVGVADTAPFIQAGFVTVPEGVLSPYSRAVSMAVALGEGVLDAMEDRPTVEYADEYRRVNALLDELSAGVAGWLTERGHRADPVAASSFAYEGELLGSVSHKAVARMAGIGWQGRSLLIVSPEYGPRIRLTTVLTDAPLSIDGPVSNGCGDCTECTDACPVTAIKGVLAPEYFASREEALAVRVCFERTLQNKAMPGIEATICDICIKACPHGA